MIVLDVIHRILDLASAAGADLGSHLSDDWPRGSVSHDRDGDEVRLYVGIPAFPLRAGDPMRMFATHVSARIRLSVTAPEGADLSDVGVLSLAIRPDIPSFLRSYAYLYLTFERDGFPVMVSVPGVNYELWLESGEVLTCAP